MKKLIIDDKPKRIALDMLINLVGTGLPLVVLQLVINPIVAKRIGGDAYGQMQSVLSILYLVAGTLGGALSTTRLVRESEYREKKLTGDYNILFWLSAGAVLCITVLVLCLYLDGAGILELLLITLASVLLFAQNYLAVSFRLTLDYRAIFWNKALCGFGYLCGFALFSLTQKWEFIFILSYVFPMLHCLLKSNLLREPSKKTQLFPVTIRSFGDLSLAALLSKALTYVDKLLLFPLLGGEAVSVYFAANIFGKLILQIVEPITNVTLSYLSQKNRVPGTIWRLCLLLGGGFCVLMYFVCLLISGPVLRLLYPQWAEAALELVPVAAASLCVSALISMIYPLTLKALETYKQVLINGVSLAVYVVSSLLIYEQYGLRGCCLALLFSYLVKIVMIFIFCAEKRHGS